MKVLLVDDNQKRSRMLTTWMLDLGIAEENITTTNNTITARGLLTKNYYDVLLLDVVLPKRAEDQALWTNGIELLRYVASSSRTKKPEKIIGITAYSDDIQSFREKFEDHCLSVIEVKENSSDWRPRLASAFNYTRNSKIARAHVQDSLEAITVHGIRTFGQWQERLKKIVQAEASFIEFHSYKYGYFAILFFAIPYFQTQEVLRLKNSLQRLFDTRPSKRFIIFAHSFGTYLVAQALAELSREHATIPVKTIVLSGSVLKSNYDWSFLDKHSNINVINECGNYDGILCLSEAFIPRTGMAGRTGFYGFNSNSFINRFYLGGHSLYFHGDSFMKANWLPLFSSASISTTNHHRPDLTWPGFILEQTAHYFGRFGFIALLVGAIGCSLVNY